MTEEKFFETRGRIVTNFAFIEKVMIRFISIHYFGISNSAFEDEVLSDKYFNFGLLENIFNKVLDNYPEHRSKVSKQNIKDLRDLRNFVAHGLQMIKGGVTYLERSGKTELATEVFDKYFTKRDLIMPQLLQLPAIGITTLENDKYIFQ